MRPSPSHTPPRTHARAGRAELVARAAHPLAGAEADLATLARYPWTIAARGAPLRDHWERMFADAALQDETRRQLFPDLRP